MQVGFICSTCKPTPQLKRSFENVVWFFKAMLVQWSLLEPSLQISIAITLTKYLAILVTILQDNFVSVCEKKYDISTLCLNSLFRASLQMTRQKNQGQGSIYLDFWRSKVCSRHKWALFVQHDIRCVAGWFSFWAKLHKYYVSKWTVLVGSEKWQFLLTISTIFILTQGGWLGQKKSQNVLT